MLVRIMARQRERKYVFAEEIESYTVISAKNNKIRYQSKDGTVSIGDLRDIVRNPEIITVLVKGHFYRIKLPEGI